jgi:hypothetical protein
MALTTPEMLHLHKTHPWVDSYGHSIALSVARRVARDVITNERWGRGVEGQPVYDVAGEHGGEFVGLLADDMVRCQVGGSVIALFSPRRPTEAEVTEQAYCRMLPRACHWEALAERLTALVASGRLVADEPIETAATRLLRNGYRPEDVSV